MKSKYKREGPDTAADHLLSKFSAVVRDCRLQLDLSQGELATRAGVTRSYISDIETGLRNNLSMKSLHRLASALESSPAALLLKAENDSGYLLEAESLPRALQSTKDQEH